MVVIKLLKKDYLVKRKWGHVCFMVSAGLMITSAALYHVLHFFHITIDIRNVCVFLAPLFSSFTAIVTYHFTKELKVKNQGLLFMWPTVFRINLK